MNLVLLQPADLETAAGSGRVRLTGRRLEHVLRVHRAQVGDVLRVGLLGGKIGTGRILALGDDRIELAVELDRPPPAPRPLVLVLALPRPLVLKRVLVHAASLGIKRIALIHANRVEKSYWQADAMRLEALTEQLLVGLEQARDTIPPVLSVHPRFRPFVEDELGTLLAGTRGVLAHPDAARECPRAVDGPVTLAIGPEGGFVPFEVEKLLEAGLEAVRLGERTLRVEAAVPYAVARLS